MEIFKFRTSGPDATILTQGETIGGLEEILWVERYREAGEFKLIGPVSLNLRSVLPAGTYISHVDTYEVMVVENHTVVETSDDNIPMMEVTGRSFETILEQRAVGCNLTRTYPPVDVLDEYRLSNTYSWAQASMMVQDHIDPDNLTDDNNQFYNVDVTYKITDLNTPYEYDSSVAPWFGDVIVPADFMNPGIKPVKRGSVYDALLELLAGDDLGIRVIRPGPWVLPGPVGLPGPWTATVYGPTTALMIHNGCNRSHRVIFSYDNGELESAEYLWSNKKKKTHALVQGKWVERMVVASTDTTGNDRRVMYVDGKFIDDMFDVAPTGTDLTDIVTLMDGYGLVMLGGQKDVEILRADVNKAGGKNVYRRDYNIGDLVRVEGNYQTSCLARVTEFVESQTLLGESSYPTLTLLT